MDTQYRAERRRQPNDDCIANSEVLYTVDSLWHFAKTPNWPSVDALNNSVVYTDGVTRSNVPATSIRPLKLVVGTKVDVIDYDTRGVAAWRAVVVSVNPEKEHTAPRSTTEITVTTLLSPEMRDPTTYITKVELNALRPSTSELEPCKCFTGVGCFRQVCSAGNPCDLQTHCPCNAGNTDVALKVRTADPTSVGGYCKECDTARSKREKARLKKNRSAMRHRRSKQGSTITLGCTSPL